MKASVLFVIPVVLGINPPTALAGPSAETAKRCMHYAYLAHPYKRPGSVRGSGDRQAYFTECMTKDGNISEPAPAKP
jgi:hypothetical protein